MKTTLKAVFFKDSGKWYATETMTYDNTVDWQKLYDEIKKYFKKMYPDLTLVVTDFGNYNMDIPIMITPRFR